MGPNSFGSSDVVLAIGLRRRLPVFSQVLKSLSHRGVKVILITDPTAQKSVQQADWVFCVEARSAKRVAI